MAHTRPHIVVLAAGKGTRMRSSLPKVAHELAGKPLIGHVLAAAEELRPSGITVVIGYQAEVVRELAPQATGFATQEQQLGTGHAVIVAMDGLPAEAETVLTLYGDVPLVKPATLAGVCAALDGAPDAGAAIITAEMPDPTGYGRILRDEAGHVADIVEEADCTAAQRAITEVNIGIGVYRRQPLERALRRLSPDNAQGEYYLTDVVRLMREDGLPVVAMVAEDAEQFQGINTPEQLTQCEARLG